MDKNNEYKKIYIQESDELLQQLNSNLLCLEKEPENKKALEAIFRSAHTLKSMSASMGYYSIADLAHKMEDVLDQLRNKTIAVTVEVVNLLFRSFDGLERMVNAVQEDKQIKINLPALLNLLDKQLVKAPSIVEERVAEGISLNEFEKKTMARVKKDGYSSYLIKVILAANCVLKSVRAFMIFRNLHTIGEVIKSYPDSSKLEEERFDRRFECIFITRAGPRQVKEKVQEILDVEKVTVTAIEIDEAWSRIEVEQAAEEEEALEAAAAGTGLRKIQSVRVDINRLDKLMNLVEELAISKLRLSEVGLKLPDPDLKTVIEELGRLTDDLQNEVMQARLVPVSHIFDRFPRLVRDLAKNEGKEVKFDVIGGDIELDRTVLDEIGDPLIHLLRNAIDHGLEPTAQRQKSGKSAEGRIMLIARREKSHVFIEVEDDGKGMDLEMIKKTARDRGLVSEADISSMSKEEIFLLTAHPGFSTKKEVTEVSGRGVGLDVVRERAESLGGGIAIESTAGKGTKISMRLPVTTAVVKALLEKLSARTFALPISSVTEIIVIEEKVIKKMEHQETILHRNKVLPIMRLDKLFSSPDANRSATADYRPSTRAAKSLLSTTSEARHRLNIVVVEFGVRQCGIVVDELLMQQDIVIKQLTKELKGIRGFAGATILGDGTVALVLDVASLI